MLDLLKDSLKANFIEFRHLKDNTNAEKSLLQFKNNDNINVLLMVSTYCDIVFF